eukprot:TRINITY_DN11143_c0_g1_i2.p3 TRINITY_DN11143_c0_g1~~TRINITY_DN11143_c0_g1_i2.p3  ORF type:complete len:159 (-),score=29.80 TRINITY_DN11143_c0_g1_i2:771-1247(-)
MWMVFFFQAEDGIRDHAQSRGLGDVYKRQVKDDDSLRERMASIRKKAEELATKPFLYVPRVADVHGEGGQMLTRKKWLEEELTRARAKERRAILDRMRLEREYANFSDDSHDCSRWSEYPELTTQRVDSQSEPSTALQKGKKKIWRKNYYPKQKVLLR